MRLRAEVTTWLRSSARLILPMSRISPLDARELGDPGALLGAATREHVDEPAPAPRCEGRDVDPLPLHPGREEAEGIARVPRAEPVAERGARLRVDVDAAAKVVPVGPEIGVAEAVGLDDAVARPVLHGDAGPRDDRRGQQLAGHEAEAFGSAGVAVRRVGPVPVLVPDYAGPGIGPCLGLAERDVIRGRDDLQADAIYALDLVRDGPVDDALGPIDVAAAAVRDVDVGAVVGIGRSAGGVPVTERAAPGRARPAALAGPGLEPQRGRPVGRDEGGHHGAAHRRCMAP